MIPKIDSYMYESLNKYLSAVLNSVGTENECYIMGEALGGMEPGTADTFKQAFTGTGKGKKSIDIRYSFPKQKESLDACYVIMRGKAQEGQTYLGSETGVHETGRPANDENTISDVLAVEHDADGYFFKTQQPILSLVDVSEMTVDNYVDYNRDFGDEFRINLLDTASALLGQQFTVVYIEKDTGVRKDNGGLSLGYNMQEHITVQSVSNNIDTMRCLDSILRYILIVMRSSFRENNMYTLQGWEADDMQVGGDSLDNPFYVMPVDVHYTVTYALPTDSSQMFESIKVNGD